MKRKPITKTKLPSWQYYAPPTQDVSPGVVTICDLEHPTGSLTGTLSSQEWVFDYSLTHCGLVKVGSITCPWRTRPARIGHLYRPGTLYWEDTRGTAKPWRSCYIVFRGGEALDLGRYVDNAWGFGRIVDPGGHAGKLIADGAQAACEGGESGFFRAQAYLYRLAELLSGLSPDAGTGEWRLSPAGRRGAEAYGAKDAEAWRRRVRAELQRDLARKFSLPELATRLSCSPSTLTHRYRRIAGESVRETLQAMRLHAAAVLLRQGHPLKEIAARTGFYDEFHLSKTFHKVRGLWPREFLRQS